jgi:beta-lactamase regulating signal transducer with metallopeptidase domain
MSTVASDAAASEGPLLLLPEPPVWLSPSVALLWAIWVIAGIARLAIGLKVLSGLRRTLEAVPAGRQARLSTWMKVHSTGRHAELTRAPGLVSPCMIGLWKPVIVLPSWMLDKLDDERIDQVVVHEWAHVQRRDDVMSLLLAMARAVAGWHPAVAWIGRAIGFEREAACDDQVLALTENPARYASCLTSVAAASRLARQEIMLPGLFTPRGTELSRRVTRLLGARRNGDTPVPGRTIACASLGVLAAAVLVGQVDAVGFVRPWNAPTAPPPPPSVYWAASFAPPAAPVAPPRVLPVSARSRLDGERRVAQSSRPFAHTMGGGSADSEPDSASSHPGLPSRTLSGLEPPRTFQATDLNGGGSAPPNHDDRPARFWALTQRVPAGAVRMSQELSRGSRRGASSTNRFFARLGRSISWSSSRAGGSGSSGDDQQP